MSLFLAISSSIWSKMTYMVLYVRLDENKMHFGSYRWKLLLSGEKNCEISAKKITKMTTWANKNVTFSRNIIFYMVQNDLYGSIRSIRWKQNAFRFITTEIITFRREKWWNFSQKITKMTPKKTKMSLFLMILSSVWPEVTYNGPISLVRGKQSTF